MAKTVKRNFKTKLHLICANDDLRPSMSYIYFEKGFLYCTDAHIMIKQKIDLHGFDEDEIKFMEGKMIHRESFKELLKHKYVKVTKEGFEAIIDSENSILFKFSTRQDDFVAKMQKTLTEFKWEKIDEIGFNYKFLSRLSDCFINPMANHGSICLQFQAANRAIRVVPNDSLAVEDQFGILMPVIINK